MKEIEFIICCENVANVTIPVLMSPYLNTSEEVQSQLTTQPNLLAYGTANRVLSKIGVNHTIGSSLSQIIIPQHHAGSIL